MRLNERTCPHCGRPLSDEGQARLDDAIAKLGLPVAPGGYLAEKHLAELLDVSRATLRKRVERGANQFEFIVRANRRFYRLTSVAEHF